MKRTFGTLWEIIAMHGFIVLLSLAAIPHSAWSINSVFGGPEPLPMYSHDWWGWYMPGLLMSITIDVGLLAFVMRLQKGERQGSLIVGYLLLCGLMAFGQFVYVASHIANFTLAAGVAEYYHDLANGIIKSAVFVYPAALPVVSAVYAFSVRQKPAPLSEITSISVDTRPPQTAVKFGDVGDLEVNTLPAMETSALVAGEAVNMSVAETIQQSPEEVETALSHITDDEITKSHLAVQGLIVDIVKDLLAKARESDVTEPRQTQSDPPERATTSPAMIPVKREYAIRTAEHHCAHCGVAFLPKNANQIYHSGSCRTLAYNERKRTL